MGIKISAAEAKKLGLKAPKKTSKYRNVRTTVDGITFDSKREAKRYSELMAMLRCGEIACVRCQVEYELHAFGGGYVGKYVADFVYLRGSREVVEDVKGVKTAMYRWKKRHMLAEYSIAIVEV